MVKVNYKRQKLNSIAKKPPVSATVYEEPEKTLMNFPSSIMNGITQEGGLVSLTFKSIKCVELVENLDLLRNSLIKDDKEIELLRISEEKFDARSMIRSLEQDIKELKEKSVDAKIVKDDDLIKRFQDDLSGKLGNKQDITEYGKELVKQYEIENPNKIIKFSNDRYSSVKDFDFSSIKLDKFEDVKEPNLSAYEKKIENSQGSSSTEQSESTTSNDIIAEVSTESIPVNPSHAVPTAPEVNSQVVLNTVPTPVEYPHSTATNQEHIQQ